MRTRRKALKDVPQDVAQDLAFGARAARALIATTTTAAVFVQPALRWGRNWAAQWHLARAVGKRFRDCRAKRLYVHAPPEATVATSTGPGFKF